MNKQNQSINSLGDLFISDVHKFRSIEVELKKVLPEWISSTNSPNLKVILREYLNLIDDHIQAMGLLLEMEKPDSISFSKSIVRVFADYLSEKLANCTDLKVKDACVLTSIRAINHFKISMYEAATAFAQSLKMDKHASFFEEVGTDEKRIEGQLTKISEHELNLKARATIALAS